MTSNRPVEELSRTDPGTADVARTLAAAFQDDPALVWIMRSAEARRKQLPRFFAIMAEQSHTHGTVLGSPERHAAALLYPSGVIKDDDLWTSLRLLSIFKTSLGRGLKVADAMHAQHPDPQPYVYLRYVGVAPSAQGKGWGGAMVRAVIAKAAGQGKGVLLETATPSNVAIYSRLGFETVSEWEVPGSGPKFWTMVHPAP